MFRLPLKLFLVGLILLSAFICFNHFHIKESDISLFKELEAKSQSAQVLSGDATTTFAQQMRQGVLKEFWLNQKSLRQLIRIASAHSELFFFPEGKNIEVVEQMDQVECLIQEELYYLLPNGQEALSSEGSVNLLLRGKNPKEIGSWVDPQKVELKPMQKIRSLKASKACYNYTTNLFIADHVKMWSYELQGHEPPLSTSGLKPLVESTAESIEFSLSGEEVSIKAHRLKAQFNSRQKIGSL